MSIDELKDKESVLRECFMEKLEMLNVDGPNDICTIKCIKTYGALWHYTHQLLMAEENDAERSARPNTTTADTMDIRATGIRMSNSKA